MGRAVQYSTVQCTARTRTMPRWLTGIYTSATTRGGAVQCSPACLPARPCWDDRQWGRMPVCVQRAHARLTRQLQVDQLPAPAPTEAHSGVCPPPPPPAPLLSCPPARPVVCAPPRKSTATQSNKRATHEVMVHVRVTGPEPASGLPAATASGNSKTAYWPEGVFGGWGGVGSGWVGGWRGRIGAHMDAYRGAGVGGGGEGGIWTGRESREQGAAAGRRWTWHGGTCRRMCTISGVWQFRARDDGHQGPVGRTQGFSEGRANERGGRGMAMVRIQTGSGLWLRAGRQAAPPLHLLAAPVARCLPPAPHGPPPPAPRPPKNGCAAGLRWRLPET